MVDYRKLQAMEDAYDSRQRMFKQIEDGLEDFQRHFRMRTDFLIDQIYDAYRGEEIPQDSHHFVYQLQDRADIFYRDVLIEYDLLDEQRQVEKKHFEYELEEAYREKEDE